MTAIAARVLRTIRRHELLPRGSRVVVGVSGGADSVALTHVLLELQPAGGFDVTGLVHVHHGLRASADRDEAFCRDLAASRSLPVHVERVDVRGRARRERLSLEDAGRRVRMEALARAADTFGSDRIAVGHTRDDQAETVLLKLLRGAGTRGLAAIHPRMGRIVRPLLDVGREELRDWLISRGMTCVEDETNADLRFRRNAVRHRVLPVLREQFGPAVTEALARQADAAREDEAVLSALAAPLVAGLVRTDEPDIVVDSAGLGGQPVALQRRVALEALRLAGVPEPGFDHVVALLALGRGETGSFHLPGGVRASTVAGSVRLVSSAGGGPRPAFRYELSVPGSVWVPEAARTVGAEPMSIRTEADLGSLRAANPETAVVSADGLGTRLIVRSWHAGDALRPIGLGGRKKLQDLFVDRKVPRAARLQVPLVADSADRIVWVPGHAIDETYRVTSGTRAVVVLTVSESGGRE